MSRDTGNAEDWGAAQRVIGDGMLSIVMPAYRLGGAIARNIGQVRDVFSDHVPFEIIPVDDGSDDNTRSEITRAGADYPEVHPVSLARNTGKGAAFLAGFRASKGSHVLLLDGDLDLPPAQVARFLEVMEQKRVDIVIGSKRHPHSQLNYPWYRHVLSGGYYLFVLVLFGLPVRDTQTGIKLFTRPVLEYVAPRTLVKRFAFDLEILAIANRRGFRVAEAPVTMDFQGGWGCARPRTVRNILLSTLAVFYRLRIMRYYDKQTDGGEAGGASADEGASRGVAS